jgi:hypothetical protein
MRRLRGSGRFVASTLLLFCVSSSAAAQLMIAEEPGEGAVEHAELAYAIGNGPPISWFSLRLSPAPVALVAALPDGASSSVALDAWFEALEATASPRVLMPRDTTNCGEDSSFVESAWPRGAGAAPDELELSAPEDVVAALAAQGVALSGELPRASRYLIWSWPALAKAATTRTLRIEGGSAPLSLLPSSAFPVLVSTLTRGAMQYPDELARSALDLTFIAGSRPRSDYRERLREWLGERSEPLSETRSRGLLFEWSIHADLVSIAPLSHSYAQRAAGELPELDAEACAKALGEPALFSPSTSACGSARDAALAFAIADPELLTLQRFVVSGARGVEPELLGAGGEPLPPVLRARQLDDSRCASSQEPPVVLEPPVVNEPVDEPRGGAVVVEETVVVAGHEHGEVDCSGSPRPEPDERYDGDETDGSDDVDCGADTSSTSEPPSGDETCAGDASSTSEPASDDATCSGDSSSTSDDSEPDCSSDSSSSSADEADAGCDGGPGDSSDEQDGYDGDTCTASAAPEREPRKSRAGLSSRSQHPTRLKTSLWSVAFAAVVLPIRRRKRVVRAAS